MCTDRLDETLERVPANCSPKVLRSFFLLQGFMDGVAGKVHKRSEKKIMIIMMMMMTIMIITRPIFWTVRGTVLSPQIS